MQYIFSFSSIIILKNFRMPESTVNIYINEKLTVEITDATQVQVTTISVDRRLFTCFYDCKQTLTLFSYLTKGLL